MTDNNNQGQKIRLHKDERDSATQIDSGGLPSVPIAYGKNYYTENIRNEIKDYIISITDPKPHNLIIWAEIPILNKLASPVIDIVDPLLPRPVREIDFTAIGLWLKKQNDKGRIYIKIYIVHDDGTKPPGPNPYTGLYALLRQVVIEASDIDSEEELILHIPAQSVEDFTGTIEAVAIVISSEGIDNNQPIKIATQAGNTDITLWNATSTPGATNQITLHSQYNNLTPMIRFYPGVERSAVRLSDAEGNIIKPNIPFQAQAYYENEFVMADYTFPEIVKFVDIAGTELGEEPIVPRAGRVKKVILELHWEYPDYSTFDPAARPTGVLFRLFRVPPNFLASYVGEKYEVWKKAIIMPSLEGVKKFAAAVASDQYFEYIGEHLSKLGLQVGMTAIKDGDKLGEVIRIEEGYRAGIPFTRIWVVDGHRLWNWAAAEEIWFDLWDGASAFFENTFSYDIDTPYRMYDNSATADIDRYKMIGMIQLLNSPLAAADFPVTLRVKWVINIEEDNIITRVNPGKSIAGIEDLERRW